MKLTANQVRILVEIVEGNPPTGLTSRGIESLIERGLVKTAIGTYKANRRFGAGPGEIYCLTEAGFESLREEIERRYNAALRAAKSERDADLKRLNRLERV